MRLQVCSVKRILIFGGFKVDFALEGGTTKIYPGIEGNVGI